MFEIINGKIQMSEDEYSELDESSQGVCLSCGETRDGCEPDAREYKCESCGEKQVYGASELLMMDKIEFKDDSEDLNEDDEKDRRDLEEIADEDQDEIDEGEGD